MKVIMCSRRFPKGHPKQGQSTFFIEQILNVILPRGENGIINRNDIKPDILPLINDFVLLDGEQKKHHTIRAGSRFKPGDMASLRVWSDKPYRSKQIEFAQVEVKKTWDIEIYVGELIIEIIVNGKSQDVRAKKRISTNDGLEVADFVNWFKIHPKAKKGIAFSGQIICWSSDINY